MTDSQSGLLNDANYSVKNNFEDKVRRAFLSLGRLLTPLIFAIFVFYEYSLNTKSYEIASFLLRVIAPLMALPMIGSMLFWCLLQVKNGIGGKPILMGNIHRQPFIFLGLVAFSFLSIICGVLIIGILYLFSL